MNRKAFDLEKLMIKVMKEGRKRIIEENNYSFIQHAVPMTLGLGKRTFLVCSRKKDTVGRRHWRLAHVGNR